MSSWQDDIRSALLWNAGSVPLRLEAPVYEGPLVQIELHSALLCVPAVGRFLVTRSQPTVVDAGPSATQADVECFLRGPVLALAALLGGGYPLRGSAVAIGGRAVLLTGAASAGKSTLAAGLVGRGHSLLSDGVVVVNHTQEVLHAGSGIDLWPQVAAAVGFEPANGTLLRPGVLKRRWPTTEGPIEATNLHCIVVFTGVPAMTDNRDLVPIAPKATLSSLVAAEWFGRAVHPLGRALNHLDWVSAMSSHPAYQLGTGSGSIDQIVTTNLNSIERTMA